MATQREHAANYWKARKSKPSPASPTRNLQSASFLLPPPIPSLVAGSPLHLHPSPLPLKTAPAPELSSPTGTNHSTSLEIGFVPNTHSNAGYLTGLGSAA